MGRTTWRTIPLSRFLRVVVIICLQSTFCCHSHLQTCMTFYLQLNRMEIFCRMSESKSYVLFLRFLEFHFMEMSSFDILQKIFFAIHF